MTKDDAVSRWKESALEDWEIAQSLFHSGKYSYCLFFCQMTLEKLLKAYYVKQRDTNPPITHNLIKIMQLAGLHYTKLTKEQLDEISTFNIEARYDIYKKTLYTKATKQFTQDYVENIKEFILWIQKQF